MQHFQVVMKDDFDLADHTGLKFGVVLIILFSIAITASVAYYYRSNLRTIFHSSDDRDGLISSFNIHNASFEDLALNQDSSGGIRFKNLHN
jgi:hypothetical protein